MASNIVIADAAATPVNHTFIPMGIDANQVYWWVDQSASNALGYWKASLSIQRPAAPAAGQNADGRNYRVKVQLWEPVLANVTNSTVSGVLPSATLAYTMRATCDFTLPEAGALLDRQNISKMFPLLLQNAQVTSVVTTLAYPGL